MSKMPGHTSPPYSEDARDDALFHYTSADGLIGILQNKEIWSTAYYCLNDESELAAGKGILTPIFSLATHEMIQDDDPLVQLFGSRGIDIREYARDFEQKIIGHTFHKLCAYITCFCKPAGEEDFKHGLLSQWKGYGVDGGYALQFSRKKLQAAVGDANKAQSLIYQLQDVHYAKENPLKSEVLRHSDSFRQAYKAFLEELGDIEKTARTRSMSSPVASLVGESESLDSLLDYLIHTKNQHYGEERECRLSLVDAVSSEVADLPTHYFNRGGLIVPYKKTSRKTFPLIGCIEWIIIGPNPRMGTRFRSVTQMVRRAGLPIEVRPSHIPFYRG